MDLLSTFFSAIGIVAAPIGYTTKKVWDIDKRLAAHIAEDDATLKGIHTTLKDLKQDQRDANEKLDRLIERFL